MPLESHGSYLAAEATAHMQGATTGFQLPVGNTESAGTELGQGWGRVAQVNKDPDGASVELLLGKIFLVPWGRHQACL